MLRKVLSCGCGDHFAVFHAAQGDQIVAQFLNFPARAAQHDHFQAIVVVDVDMERGNDVHVGIVLEMWLREAVANKDDRCGCCYTIRLRATAREAAAKGFDAFSTTLLYSRYQKHDRIKQAAQAASEEFGVPFLYRDLRTGWSEGIRISKRLRLYRQQYCGCIYSEKERYIDSVKR